jgi:1,4-alpha-glucan branching enzyme
MSPYGAFVLVMHLHVPAAYYALDSAAADENLYRTCAETVIPVLDRLRLMADSGSAPRVTLGITPTVAERLASTAFKPLFLRYLDDRIAAAQRDFSYYSGEPVTASATPADAYGQSLQQPPDSHMAFLAQRAAEFYTSTRETFIDTFGGDLIAALRTLEADDHIELMTSAASYAYLPLHNPTGMRAQIRAAVAIHERLFGRRPVTLWLPGGGLSAEVARALTAEGIRAVVVEPHLITGGPPSGAAAGETLGRAREIKQIFTLPHFDFPLQQPRSPRVAYQTADRLAVLSIDQPTLMQIWGGVTGYPGDFDYRAQDRRASLSSLNYWRVTGPNIAADRREPYHPDWAGYKTDQHAEHFAHLVSDLLRPSVSDSDRYGAVVTAFETDQFTHYWFEGADWVLKTIRILDWSSDIELLTVRGYLEQHPPAETVEIHAGSAGLTGTHFTWNNGTNRWTWPAINSAVERMTRLIRSLPQPDESARVVLTQMTRELLIAQSADWQTYMAVVRSPEAYSLYARLLMRHLERFNHLASGLESGSPDTGRALLYGEELRVLPHADFRWFGD